jgi:hypothetical protein
MQVLTQQQKHAASLLLTCLVVRELHLQDWGLTISSGTTTKLLLGLMLPEDLAVACSTDSLLLPLPASSQGSGPHAGVEGPRRQLQGVKQQQLHASNQQKQIPIIPRVFANLDP